MSDTDQQHTPGPWTFDEHPHSGWGMVRGADGMPVASTAMAARYAFADVGKPANPEIRANAHLIAAAPDLLETVKCFLDWFERMGYRGHKLELRARVAIAKAEGR